MDQLTKWIGIPVAAPPPYAQEPGLGMHSEPWGNVGQEIPTYMRFILMFWDHLPERMAGGRWWRGVMDPRGLKRNAARTHVFFEYIHK